MLTKERSGVRLPEARLQQARWERMASALQRLAERPQPAHRDAAEQSWAEPQRRRGPQA